MKKPYIKPSKLSDDFEELKEFMDYSVDIEHWNSKRETAKKYFTMRVIGLLDASGFIKIGIRPLTQEDINAII
jgi:hypothetical protein